MAGGVGGAGTCPAPAERGSREEHQPGGGSPSEAASAEGWGPYMTPSGAAIPSPLLSLRRGGFCLRWPPGLACPGPRASSGTGPSPGVAGHGTEGWEPPSLQGSPWDLLQGPFLWPSLCGRKLQLRFSR